MTTVNTATAVDSIASQYLEAIPSDILEEISSKYWQYAEYMESRAREDDICHELNEIQSRWFKALTVLEELLFQELNDWDGSSYNPKAFARRAFIYNFSQNDFESMLKNVRKYYDDFVVLREALYSSLINIHNLDADAEMLIFDKNESRENETFVLIATHDYEFR